MLFVARFIIGHFWHNFPPAASSQPASQPASARQPEFSYMVIKSQSRVGCVQISLYSMFEHPEFPKARKAISHNSKTILTNSKEQVWMTTILFFEDHSITYICSCDVLNLQNLNFKFILNPAPDLFSNKILNLYQTWMIISNLITYRQIFTTSSTK